MYLFLEGPTEMILLLLLKNISEQIIGRDFLQILQFHLAFFREDTVLKQKNSGTVVD